MKDSILNIYNLGIKELKTLFRDTIMVILIIYSFSFAIYIGATSQSTELHNASIAFVNEDKSTLSYRIIEAFYKPRFKTPDIIKLEQIDTNMNNGYYTFVVVIPSGFERDFLSSKSVDIQVNIDATRMTQAGIGAGYIQNIIMHELRTFTKSSDSTKIKIINRYKYNQNLTSSWFGSINEVINNIVMLSILLSAAALIREREDGTIEHLLVMPLSPIEIMLSKIWSVGIVVLICVSLSLIFIVQMLLQVPLSGSIPLFLLATFLVLFATTSMGIFIGTVVKNMPQLGMIFIITILPLIMLSGGISPFESMPKVIQVIMSFMPTSYFVNISQDILFKGAGIEIVWLEMLKIFLIGVAFFILTFLLFRKSLESQM